MNWYWGILGFMALCALAKCAFELEKIYNLLRRREKELDFLRRPSTGPTGAKSE